MSSLLLPYILQLLPILAGAAVFILLKSVNPSRSKISIFVDSTSIPNLPEQKVLKQSATTYLDSFIYDSLIINGKISRPFKGLNLERKAFEELGYLSNHSIYNLPKYIRHAKPKKITLFLDNDSSTPASLFSHFDKPSGLLLWYAINGNMEVVRYA